MLVVEAARVRRLEAVDIGAELAEVALGGVEGGQAEVDAHHLDADVVDVVRLVEDDDALALHRARDELRDLRVEEVLVVVHDDVGERDHVTREEVRAPPLRPPEALELLERVHAGLQRRVGPLLLELLV